MLTALMFDTETQRNGYTWIVDYSEVASKELLSVDRSYFDFCSSIDELAMAGLPLMCNMILHVNAPTAMSALLRFSRLVFPKNLRNCTAYRPSWFHFQTVVGTQDPTLKERCLSLRVALTQLHVGTNIRADICVRKAST